MPPGSQEAKLQSSVLCLRPVPAGTGGQAQVQLAFRASCLRGLSVFPSPLPAAAHRAALLARSPRTKRGLGCVIPK